MELARTLEEVGVGIAKKADRKLYAGTIKLIGEV